MGYKAVSDSIIKNVCADVLFTDLSPSEIQAKHKISNWTYYKILEEQKLESKKQMMRDNLLAESMSDRVKQDAETLMLTTKITHAKIKRLAKKNPDDLTMEELRYVFNIQMQLADKADKGNVNNGANVSVNVNVGSGGMVCITASREEKKKYLEDSENIQEAEYKEVKEESKQQNQNNNQEEVLGNPFDDN